MAIVGASGKGTGITTRPLHLLRQHGFAGGIYPVNPRYDRIDGLRCYPDLASIEGAVDVVLSLVPAQHTADVVRQAAAVGARVVVIFASGFAEVGDAGARMQSELTAIARETGVRVIGPNCQGLIHVPSSFFGTFTAAADREMRGTSGVAYVGQSGAIGGSVLDLSAEMGLGLTAWASTGNQADVDLVEVADALVDDDEVRVVLMYAEAITDGARFVALAEHARQAGKRLVLLRSGRSAAGKRAAASHTGAMLGDDRPLVAAAERYGVILVDDVDEMLAVGAALSGHQQMRGNRLGIVTTSGGAGILLADHAELNGVEVATLTDDTMRALTPLVPAFGAVGNPVDVTAQVLSGPSGNADFAEVCRLTAEDPNVDALAVVLTMVTGARAAGLAETLVDVARASIDKPLWVVWLASREQTLDARGVFRDAGLPIFASAGDLARTVAHVAPAPVSGAPGSPSMSVDPAVLQNRPDRLARVFRALGIERATPSLATSGAQARDLADRVGGPVAMKINAASVPHKSDIGGVLLNVSPDGAEAAFDALVAAARGHRVEDLAGIDVEPMARPGVELIVGVTAAGDGFPAVVSVGLGGTTTEVFHDIASASAPVDEHEASMLLRRLQAWPLLDAFRGGRRADVEAAARAVSAVSALGDAARDRVIEFEINPLIVHEEGHGATAADALLRLEPDADPQSH
ncbi:acetate--CoA ligase family protein [Cumulibacter manganitolerans]|uniref:acetate--CoA ligase family protein n=1 Tax=Cumulibacter manganitolerans TaxID=1884992 RepID=UPI001E56D3BE|nr:acetate--CoA ligase family protein [Cumulibacter manganitolerans]